MGFNNPGVPWHEIERTLSDRKPAADPAGWWARGHAHDGFEPEPGPDPGAEPGGGRDAGDRGQNHGVDHSGHRERGRGGRPRDGRVSRLPEGANGGDSPAWSHRRPAYEPPGRITRRVSTTPYAELHCHSNFSFLDGASHPEELAEEAAQLDLDALALTDHDGFYGVVRFAEAARTVDVPTVFGAELSLGLTRPQNGEADPEGDHLLVLARDPEGYARLATTLSSGHLAGNEKGRPDYSGVDWSSAHGGHWVVLTGCRKGAVPRALVREGPAAAGRELARLVETFGADNVVVELSDHGDPLDSARNDALAALAVRAGLGIVATNNVHYAAPSRRRLATALAAVRARRSLDDLAGWLPAAGTAHLRSGDEQATRFARWPGAVEHAAELGRSCAFDLSLVAPQLPPFPCPDGLGEMAYLRRLAFQGAERRYGPRGARGLPIAEADRNRRAWEQVDHELAVIEALGYPGYFLVVWDIVEFCRRAGIYCQGRGSAANSAVCYALGITNADAVSLGLLFERFLSPERDGPPDIDIDIESGRREEVIQYVYRRHGRRHAAQVANVISYRARSAVRDMARALGYSTGQQDAWSKRIDPWGTVATTAGQADHEIPAPVLSLAAEVERMPRHLGIHSGGMVICDRPIVEVCPVEWGRFSGKAGVRDGRRRTDGTAAGDVGASGTGASHGAGAGADDGADRGAGGGADDEVVPLRTVLQWDKDDCAAVGLVKFDLLGLGMLEVLHGAIDLVREVHGTRVDLATIPQDDEVYEMLCRADSVGVFQVESRAQMATLPRLQPRTFYDLVVEVALIRPGPIQGGSVHPYIRRRKGLEPVTYLHPLLEPALAKTLGVPLFQEQLMQMAIDAAGFTPAEADQLRQAMGSKRSAERMERLRGRLYAGMAERGVVGDVADRIWEKLAAFASYGFPESHSVSFAYLVYASSWLKRYYPAAFCAALLNAQPMGFYSPHTLVQDARRHGVEVRTPDLNVSGARATLEVDALGAQGAPGAPADPPSSRGHGFRPDEREAMGSTSGTHCLGPRSVEPDASGSDDVGAGPVTRLVAATRPGAVTRPGSVEPDASGSDGVGAGPVTRLVAATRPGAVARPGAVTRPGAATRLGPAPVDAPPGEWGRGGPSVRLGLGSVRGLGEDLAARIVDERRAHGPYAGPEDLVRRVPGLSVTQLEALATSGALGCFGLDRRRALWVAGAVASTGADRLAGIVTGVEAPPLPGMEPVDEARADLWATGVSPEGHPTIFVREVLDGLGAVPAARLVERPHGSRVTVAGVVTHRQRPATAGGTTFVNLEDETGLLNIVVSKGCWTHHRRVVRTSPALLVRGRLERVDGVVNVIAERIEPLPIRAAVRSRDFR